MSDTVNPPFLTGVPIGGMLDWIAPVIPQRWVECTGQSLLRATYGSLFGVLVVNKGAVTISNASPGVFTKVGHGLKIGDPVFLETTGALPTGLTADHTYYVMTVPTSSTFTVGTTRAISTSTNTAGSVTVTTAVNTSSAGSGTHTLFYAPYGVADSTHFSLPDFTWAVGMGWAGPNPSGAFAVLGVNGGERAHLQLSGESGVPVHVHAPLGSSTSYTMLAATGGTWVGANPGFEARSTTGNNTAADAAASHNNVQPSIAVKKIIYTGVPS